MMSQFLQAKSHQAHNVRSQNMIEGRRPQWLNGTARLGSQYDRFRPSLNLSQFKTMTSFGMNFQDFAKFSNFHSLYTAARSSDHIATMASFLGTTTLMF